MTIGIPDNQHIAFPQDIRDIDAVCGFDSMVIVAAYYCSARNGC